MTILPNFRNIKNHHVTFAVDLNIFFDVPLDAKCGTPTLKIQFINKKVMSTKKHKYTSWEKNLSGIIQQWLDYIYLTNSLRIKNI